MNRVDVFKSILWALTGLAVATALTRFLFGLGAISNLSDSTPWGIWKGLNVVPGIALAAGGFVVTAVIYVMKKEEYHQYAKVAVLIALLGYLSAATALVLELGLPWLVWQPVIYWQLHSALFEVSWCVMLYLTVLLLEFLPVPLEETSRFAGVRRFLTKYKLVLVILGIMISSLHQSSLGTLFLITPEKLHPLWYSSLLSIQFLISAIAVGPLMVIFGIQVISYLYRKEPDRKTLSKLSFLGFVALVIFGLIRLVDIGVNGKLSMIFDGSWQATVFLIEMALMLVIPMALLGIRKLRYSQPSLAIGCLSAVIGLGLNRANMAGIMLNATSPQYYPTIYEVFISLGILAGAVIVFFFFVERFKVWDAKWKYPQEQPEYCPQFDLGSDVWLGTPNVAGRVKYSLVFVLSFALAFAMMPHDRIESKGVVEVVAQKALGGDTLFIDGNHNSFGTMFEHARHVDDLGNKESCVKCHHMNLPKDLQSECSDCHRSMYAVVDVFRHDWHAAPDGANIACDVCHEPGQEKQKSSASNCRDCHLDLYADPAADTLDTYLALSYVDAMHGQCITCHQLRADEDSTKVALTQCVTCHTGSAPDYLKVEMLDILNPHSGDNVILPQITLESATKQGPQGEHQSTDSR